MSLLIGGAKQERMGSPCDQARAHLLLLAFLLLSDARGSCSPHSSARGGCGAGGRQGDACKWGWRVGRWDLPKRGRMGLTLRGGYDRSQGGYDYRRSDVDQSGPLSPVRSYDWSQQGPCGGCGSIPMRHVVMKQSANTGRAFYSCFGKVLPSLWLCAGEGCWVKDSWIHDFPRNSLSVTCPRKTNPIPLLGRRKAAKMPSSGRTTSRRDSAGLRRAVLNPKP